MIRKSLRTADYKILLPLFGFYVQQAGVNFVFQDKAVLASSTFAYSKFNQLLSWSRNVINSYLVVWLVWLYILLFLVLLVVPKIATVKNSNDPNTFFFNANSEF